ncbi:MAG: Proline dehydrogenase 1 [Candidatus Marinimicrobia bacterium]|nr:Proline dehydrogenase 1 [Candidatus Neomarinimicrobiota bacterium]
MNWLNKLIVGLMPIAPKFLIGQVAKRYIAGEELEDGIQRVYKLNDHGFLGTMDVLGESITDKAGTEKPMRLYKNLIRELGEHPDLRTGISVKLTQLGLNIDKEFCWENFKEILEMGQEIDLLIRIDMEDSSVTEDTLQIVERAHEIYPKVGAVIQAYLHRSEEDMHRLLEQDINVRLCKGIYKESASIAYQSKEEVRENFIKLGKIYLANGGYLGIATHDEYLIDHFRTYIENKGITTDNYEYQALLGVPIEHILQPLVDDGKTVRIYVPFGEDWYAYSSRRLKENPDIAGYVIKDFFKRDKLS